MHNLSGTMMNGNLISLQLACARFLLTDSALHLRFDQAILNPEILPLLARFGLQQYSLRLAVEFGFMWGV